MWTATSYRLPAILLAVLTVIASFTEANLHAGVFLDVPDKKALFPTMFYDDFTYLNNDNVAYLSYYDVFFTAPYVPSSSIYRKGRNPAYICQYGFSARPFEDWYLDRLGFREEIRDFTKSPFFHGSIEEVDRIDLMLRYFRNGNPEGSLTLTYDQLGYTMKPNYEAGYIYVKYYLIYHGDLKLKQITTKTDYYDDGTQWGGIGHMCTRKTWIRRRVECNNRIIHIYPWSYNRVYYQDARNLCQQQLGFDLPTRSEMSYLSFSEKMECVAIQYDHRESWLVSDVVDTNHLKQFFCIGCRLDFRDARGVQKIDSAGKVTCQGDYKLETLPGVKPVCKNGNWDVNTIGRCRRYFVSIANYIYQMKSDMTKSCNDQPYPGHVFHFIPYNAVYKMQSLHELHSMFATYNKSFANFGKNYASALHVIQQRVCTHFCHPLYERTMSYIDRIAGIVVCKDNHLWTCPNGNCARQGQPRPEVKCSNFQWRNIAECNPGHAWVGDYLKTRVGPHLLNKNLVAHVETASIQCIGKHYESCSRNNENLCAGGPRNIPLEHAFYGNGHPYWNNLPTCRGFSELTASNNKVHYFRSTSSETAERAKWACEQHGMHLLSQIQYSATSAAVRDEIGTAVWIEDSTGSIKLYTGDQLKAATSGVRKDFVCVKYPKIQALFSQYIEYSQVPEVCSCNAVLKTNGPSGFEQCSSRPKPYSDHVVCPTHQLWTCPYRCAREGDICKEPREFQAVKCQALPEMVVNQLTTVVNPDLSQNHFVNITMETGTLQCTGPSSMFYESCSWRHNDDCAGGPTNLPPQLVDSNTAKWKNLPQCRPFGWIRVSAHHNTLAKSSTNETAVRAEWACKKVGMNLLTESQYEQSTAEEKTQIGVNIWIVTSKANKISLYGGTYTKRQRDYAKRAFVCAKFCNPLYEYTMSYLDRKKGTVVCKENYLWTCPNGNCAREGQPQPEVVCRNNVWLNLAECNPGHARVGGTLKTSPTVQSALRDRNLIATVETASVKCRDQQGLSGSSELRFYWSCPNENSVTIPCAGGPKNIPLQHAIDNNGNPYWTNLPECRFLRLINDTANNVKYAKSVTRETAVRAKWACEKIGMNLITHAQLQQVTDQERKDLDYTTGFWVVTSGNSIFYFDGASQTPQTADVKRFFVCTKFDLRWLNSPHQNLAATFLLTWWLKGLINDKANNLKYAKSVTMETAVRAKWACERIGMNLITHEQLQQVTDQERKDLDYTTGFWVVTSGNSIFYFDGASQTQQAADVKKFFVCTK